MAPRLRTRPMFGSLSIYAGEKIVFILRRRQNPATLRDDGVWIATFPEHNMSLQKDLPSLRPIELFASRNKKGFSGWLNLPEDEEHFEEFALQACRMVIREDPRIGKIPKPR